MGGHPRRIRICTHSAILAGMFCFLTGGSGDHPANAPAYPTVSEGELAVMATDVEAFLWLVAQGHGPHEGMGWSVPSDEPDPRAWEIARRHAPDAPRVPAEILRRAQEEFPNFQEYIDAQCN